MARVALAAAESTSPDGQPARRIGGGIVVAGAVALAVVSLVLPVTLAFDPWAWLVWGREVGRLDLDTTGGPSWKPLPVLATTVLSAAGGAAPTLWLVVARAASLLALAGAFRLGARLAGRWAGALAAALLVLTPDLGARFSRLTAEGHVATIGTTLALFAIDRHLAGARRQALTLATALALVRPEAWPLLGLYAAWLWWRDRTARPLVAALAAAVPVLWFGGDWWGSGDPLHGANAAQVASGGSGERLTMAIEHASQSVALPVWVAAGACLVLVHGRLRRMGVAFAALAGSWIATVIAMAALGGYAALSRFFLPAAALACVLAAAAVVRGVTHPSSPRARVAVAAVIVLASLPGLLPRAIALDRLAAEAHTRHRLDRSLDAAIADAGGRGAVLACGAVAIDNAGLAGPLLPGLAWKFDVPLHRVRRDLDGRAGVRVARARTRVAPSADGVPIAVVGRSDEWVVYAIGCPAPGL